MSIRKRKWPHAGQVKEAWVVDYVDKKEGGTRRLKTFARKRDADAFNTKMAHERAEDVHVADRASTTVAKAGELWLTECRKRGLERATLERNARHVRLHINPFLGSLRLNRLTAPRVKEFENELLKAKRSPALIRGVLVSLGGILGEAFDVGLVAQNVVRSRKRKRRANGERKLLKAGVDIPTPAEIKQLVPHLTGRWRPLILTAAFTGLRASELRGLRWEDVDLKKGELHVRQRADRWGTIGEPKSAAGTRTVPLPPMLVSILREWRLACPPGDLVFPTGAGKIMDHTNILVRGLHPAMVKAGLVTKDGKAKYPGLHALRHFYASWCINRKADGGLELPLKVVQARLGHSSITMTADRYGHLFPRGDDGAEMAAAERAILG